MLLFFKAKIEDWFISLWKQIPSKKKDLEAKYSPIGKVIIRRVKNSSVLSTETSEPSFLNECKEERDEERLDKFN